jgi:predicted transposase YbfD/YdcC
MGAFPLVISSWGDSHSLCTCLAFGREAPTRDHKIEAKNGVREFSSWLLDISLAYKDALHLLKRATWRRVLRQSTIPS